MPQPFSVTRWMSCRENVVPVRKVLLALSAAGKSLVEIDSVDISWTIWQPEEAPFGFGSETKARSVEPEGYSLPALKPAIQYLRRLDLPLDMDIDSYDYTTRVHDITSFIQVAPMLEDLSLCFHGDWLARYMVYGTGARVTALSEYPNITLILNPIELSRLSTLYLANCTMSEQCFTGFIERHISTLKDPELYFVGLLAPEIFDDPIGSWERTIKRITPKLSLDNVELAWLQDEVIIGKIEATLSEDVQDQKYNHVAFCEDVTEYMAYRGRMKFPVYGEPSCTRRSEKRVTALKVSKLGI